MTGHSDWWSGEIRVKWLMMLFEILSPNQDYITCTTSFEQWLFVRAEKRKRKFKILKDFGSSYTLDMFTLKLYTGSFEKLKISKQFLCRPIVVSNFNCFDEGLQSKTLKAEVFCYKFYMNDWKIYTVIKIDGAQSALRSRLLLVTIM